MKKNKLQNDNNKYILGLSTMGTSAACIFKGRKLIAAIEEERITRIKNDGGFPIESIKECLKIEGISIEDISAICIYWKPFKLSTRIMGVIKKIFFSVKFNTSMRYTFNRIYSLFLNTNNNLYPEDRGSWLDLFFIKKIIKKNNLDIILLSIHHQPITKFQ